MGSPSQCDQPEQRYCAVTDEIEGVGLERLTIGKEPTNNFDQTEAEVQQDDEPEGTAIRRVAFYPLGVTRTAASGYSFAHPGFLQATATARASKNLLKFEDTAPTHSAGAS